MRHSRIIFAFLIAMAVQTTTSHAITIDSYKIITDIIDERTVNENIVITLTNDQNHSINAAVISLPKESVIKSIRDTYGILEYRTSKSNDMSVAFNFTKPLPSRSSRILMLDIETGDLIMSKYGYFEYILVFTPRQNITDFEHLLKLPKNAELYTSGGDMRIVFPEATEERDNDILSLLWRLNIEAGHPEVFMVRFTAPYTDWLLLGGYSIFLIAALFALRFLYYRINDSYRRSKMLGSVKLLNENEKNIIELIIRNEGISQHVLREKLGYKKSAVSKIITRLITRDILEKKRYGKINRLYIGKRVKRQ